MRKEVQRNFIITGLLFLLFLLFTLLVLCVDVQPIGPEGSKVGFASLNKLVHESIGEHTFWYEVSKYAGMLPLLTALGFGIIGVVQLIQGKSLYKVDIAIVLMGAFYVLVAIAYVFFEVVTVNYRPMIVDVKEGLEASYPSTHTILSVSIMSAAIIYANKRIKDRRLRIAAIAASVIIMITVVVGRLLSGVHWFTDIVGGVILSAALVTLYHTVLDFALSLHRRKSSKRG